MLNDLALILSAIGGAWLLICLAIRLIALLHVVGGVYRRKIGDPLRHWWLRGPPRYRRRFLESLGAETYYDPLTRRCLSYAGADLAADRFLRRLEWTRTNARRTPDHEPRLIAHRAEFRALLGDTPVAGLCRAFRYGQYERRRIAVWLLGRLRHKGATPFLATLIHHESRELRREAVRALRRLEAWAELRTVAEQEPDPAIRRLAAPRPTLETGQRVAQFVGPRAAEFDERFAAPSRMPLVINTEIGPRRKPRPVEWIRGILMRIHRAVHGNGARPSGNGA